MAKKCPLMMLYHGKPTPKSEAEAKQLELHPSATECIGEDYAWWIKGECAIITIVRKIVER